MKVEFYVEGRNDMEQALVKTIEHLKEVSNEKHNQGTGLRGVSESLSEWNFGYSEGIEYAIEQITSLIKKQVD